MPDESCRKCGGLLLEYTVCAECRSTNQFVCRICGTKTEIRYHDTICFNVVEAKNVVTTCYDVRHATNPKLSSNIPIGK